MSLGLRIGDVEILGRVLIAPMTGVSDLPFRRAAVRLGAPYVATEMVACAELARGRPDVVRRAAVGDGLNLTVIQLVGRDPAMVSAGARLAAQAGADIVDLNFGCPAKEVTGSLAGSAVMRDPELFDRLVGSAVEASRRPVTVKMRLGWDSATRNAPALAERAQALGVAAVTVHGRTRSQFYRGQADWKAVAEVKRAVAIPVIVNGDITDYPTLAEALTQSGADAAMIGRGVYGRPWVAASLQSRLEAGTDRKPAPEEGPGPAERLQIVLEHYRDALTFYGDHLGLRIFRKHLGWYVQSAAFAGDIEFRRQARARLCRMENPADVEAALTALWSKCETASKRQHHR